MRSKLLVIGWLIALIVAAVIALGGSQKTIVYTGGGSLRFTFDSTSADLATDQMAVGSLATATRVTDTFVTNIVVLPDSVKVDDINWWVYAKTITLADSALADSLNLLCRLYIGVDGGPYKKIDSIRLSAASLATGYGLPFATHKDSIRKYLGNAFYIETIATDSIVPNDGPAQTTDLTMRVYAFIRKAVCPGDY